MHFTLDFYHRCVRSKKRPGNDKFVTPNVTFRDVAGVNAACDELLEVVACLRDAAKYTALNAKTPSGVLLCGPPGTGKTLLGELDACYHLPLHKAAKDVPEC